jgi:hypothetical protein
MSDNNSSKTLGQFLKSRRERLLPEKIGVTDTSRRRTPGLRREEGKRKIVSHLSEESQKG